MRASSLCSVALAAVLGIGAARAQWTDAESALLFSGVDLWRHGGFVHAGLLWSPGGLDREGFTTKAMSGIGTYRYRSGTTTFTALHALDTVMAGWRLKRGTGEATVLAGIDQQYHDIVPFDPVNRLRGENWGMRISADLWCEPMPLMMMSASIGYSTVGTSFYARGAVGWRLLDAFYVGPELHLQGDDRYRQFRLGLHATAFKTGPLEWSAAVGFAQDSDARTGPYGRLGAQLRMPDP